MPYNPTTDESIRFLNTGVKDPFPTAYNAGNSSIAERFTKVWAEYHNKIRNFIGIVEPLCSVNTAEDQGLSSVTYWTLNPTPTINDILFGSAQKAYQLGKAPPSTILPFEIVITSSTDSYINWPKLTGSVPPMLYQASAATINKITLGNLASIKPMVQCCLKATSETFLSTRWGVTSYCINGTDTLVIRGSLIDLVPPASPQTTSLPPITSSFPDASIHKLHVTLVGARP